MYFPTKILSPALLRDRSFKTPLERRELGCLVDDYQPAISSRCKPTMAPITSRSRSRSARDLLPPDAVANESLDRWSRASQLLDAASVMKAQLAVELEKSYDEHGHTDFARQAHHLWDDRLGLMFPPRNSTPKVHSFKLADFCNKPTTLYWAHSAQEGDHCPLFVSGCIYKEMVPSW